MPQSRPVPTPSQLAALGTVSLSAFFAVRSVETINRVIREANLMAGGEQFGNDGRADKAGGSCDEDLHACILSSEWDKQWQICYPVKVVTLSWYNLSQPQD